MPLAADKVPELQACLDGKDAAGLTSLGADAYQPLIAAAGPVDQALKRLRTLNAGDGIEERLDAVSILADGLRNRVGVTSDPTEDRKSTRMNSSHSCPLRMPSSA